MENATMNCSPASPNTVLSPEDGEVFQRVWKRVMPDASESCPIEIRPAVQTGRTQNDEMMNNEMMDAEISSVEMRAPEVRTTIVGGDLPCTCVHPPQDRQEEPASLPALADRCSPHRGGDFPDISQVQKLGPGSCVYGSMLQRQAMDALEAWQLYRCLARRSTGKCGRTLSSMASEKHHAARRLSAAYFLISGVRFWPVDRLATPRIPSYLGTIRQAYQAEQRREQAYLMSAAETADEALQELYQDLAAQSGAHGQALRGILEQNV